MLALVAHGLTDAEVAARLVLSPRTVNAHLTSIYNKLGISSRPPLRGLRWSRDWFESCTSAV